MESQLLLDTVIFQSTIPISFLDIEEGNALSMECPSLFKGSNHSLVAFKMQEPAYTLGIKVRTEEGHFGDLSIYAVPEKKECLNAHTASVTRLYIKPLSLHLRTTVDPNESQPMNELKITGNFTVSEINNFLSRLMNEIPAHKNVTSNIIYNYMNAYLKTMLKIEISDGLVLFYSDSISTINIIKDALNADYTMKKPGKMSLSYKVNKHTIESVLGKVNPKIEYLKELTNQ